MTSYGDSTFLKDCQSAEPFPELLAFLFGVEGTTIPCVSSDHEDSTPSMHVYEDHAHCFGCGLHLNHISAMMLAAGCLAKDAKKSLSKRYTLDISEQELDQQERYQQALTVYVETAEADLQTCPEAIKALKARGCPDDIIAGLGLAVNSHQRNLELLKVVNFDGCIIFPQYRSGLLIGVQAWNYAHIPRLGDAKYVKQTEHLQQLWGTVTDKHEVTIVEGPQDEWTLRAAGIPCLCAGGVEIQNDDIVFLRSFEKVYLFFDNDEAGKQATEKYALLLPNAFIPQWNREAKDMNDLWQEVSKSKFVSIFKGLQAQAVESTTYLLKKLEGARADTGTQQKLFDKISKHISLMPELKAKGAIQQLKKALGGCGFTFTEKELTDKVKTSAPRAEDGIDKYFSNGKFVALRLADELWAEYGFFTFPDTGQVMVQLEETDLYREGGEAVVEHEAQVRLGDKVTNQRIAEVLGIIRRRRYITREALSAALKNHIPVKNCIIDRSRKKPDDSYETVPYSRETVYLYRLDVVYDPAATCPEWENYLQTTVPGEERFVQEFWGDLLIPHSPDYWVMHHGIGFNGKDVMLNTMTRFLGAESVSNESWYSYENDKFATASTFGKAANINADMGSNPLRETANMKKLTGRSRVPLEDKYRKKTYYYATAKQHHACNKLSKTEDVTFAFFNRIKLLEYPFVFVDSPRPDTNERTKNPALEAELQTSESLSGILKWALVGADRLEAQKFVFTETAAGQDVKNRWMKKADSLAWFVATCVDRDDGAFVFKDVFEAEYRKFCKEENVAAIETTRNITVRLPELITTSKFRPASAGKRREAWKDISIADVPRRCYSSGKGSLNGAVEVNSKPPKPDSEEEEPTEKEPVTGLGQTCQTSFTNLEENFKNKIENSTEYYKELVKTCLTCLTWGSDGLLFRHPDLSTDSGAVVWSPSEVQVLDARSAELAIAIEYFKDADVLAIDFETDRKLPSKKSKKQQYEVQPRLLSLSTPERTAVFDLYLIPLSKFIPVIKSAGLLLGQNLSFELDYLHKEGFDIRKAAYFDTWFAGRVHSNIADAHFEKKNLFYEVGPDGRKHYFKPCELGRLVHDYLNVKLDKARQLADRRALQLPADDWLYSANDTRILFPLMQAQLAALERNDLLSTAELEMQLLPVTFAMEQAGMPVDVVAWRERIAADKARLQQLDTIIIKAWGKFNVSSDRQLKTKLLQRGYDVPDTKVSTLKQLAPKPEDAPALLALVERSSLSKDVSTYGENLIRQVRDGRLYGRFLQLGTVTGRFASKEPNLQNLPHNAFRTVVAARQGWLLLSIDYSQIELRIVAEIAGCESMLKAFREGGDIHATTARSFLELQGAESRITPEAVWEVRAKAKAVNFGLIYGMSAQGLVDHAWRQFGIRLSLEEAEIWRDAFFDTYPELRDWHERQQAVWETRTLGGRRRMAIKGEHVNDNGEDTGLTRREKFNTPVQGTAADIMKRALVLIWHGLPELAAAGDGKSAAVDDNSAAKLIGCIHDEVLLEVQEDKVADVAAFASACMEAAGSYYLHEVRLTVEAKMGKNWWDMQELPVSADTTEITVTDSSTVNNSTGGETTI